MSFKKYDGSIWQPITPKKLKGIPYTGTLPATLTGTKAGYLHRYKVYGNTEQTGGTPTPENPIYPSGCGVRTENLFSGEFSQFDNVGGTGDIYAYFYIPEDFTLTLIAKDTHTIPVNIAFGITKDGGRPTGGFKWAIGQRQNVAEGDKFTVKSSINGYHYVSMYRKLASVLDWILEHYYVMLNLGSTPLPYEPYGYKLPLTVNGVEYPIYFGESQTTRRIKKLVLTGEQGYAWYKSATRNYSWYFYSTEIGAIAYTPFYCSHGETVTNVQDYTYGTVFCDNSLNLGIFDSSINSSAQLNAYLAAQYANGTPVTVWYVLAEPETAVVNEPLMKIGDYADTIDSTQTSAQIPTTANSTTISWAGEGLAPSQFDSIQEWVDIPTYTRVNGEWVADN